MQATDENQFSFAVATSAGVTKTLETIEEEQSATTVPPAKVMFDPALVYGLSGISAVFGVIGIGACVAVVVVTNRRKKEKKQVQVAPADNQKATEIGGPKFVCMRTTSPDKILVAEHQSHGKS